MEIVVIILVTWLVIITLVPIYACYKFFKQMKKEWEQMDEYLKKVDDETTKSREEHNVVIIKYTRTKHGYSCVCDLIPGWVAASRSSFEGFKRFVQESIDFYLDGRKQDGEPYALIFDDNYELVFVEVTEG